MNMIELRRPIEKPKDRVVLREDTYLFRIGNVTDAKTRDGTKQLLRVVFRVAQAGEYFDEPVKQAYSIEDDAGNANFGRLLTAIYGEKHLDAPVNRFGPDELVGQLVYLKLEVVERTFTGDDGVSRTSAFNDIARQKGYAHYDAPVQPVAAPVAAPAIAVPAAAPVLPAVAVPIAQPVAVAPVAAVPVAAPAAPAAVPAPAPVVAAAAGDDW